MYVAIPTHLPQKAIHVTKKKKEQQKTSHPLPHLPYEYQQKVKDKHSFMFYRDPLKTIIKNSETKLKHPNHMHTWIFVNIL